MIETLKTAGCALFLLVAIVMTVSGFGGLFEGHGDPELAGQGRLHDAFIEEEPCDRLPSQVCERVPSVKLDLPGGQTEVLGQKELHDLVRREGELPVEVEWVKELASATRVRYEGRWYRAGHPSEGSLALSIFTLAFGALLVLYSGSLLLGRFSSDDDPEAGPTASSPA